MEAYIEKLLEAESVYFTLKQIHFAIWINFDTEGLRCDYNLHYSAILWVVVWFCLLLCLSWFFLSHMIHFPSVFRESFLNLHRKIQLWVSPDKFNLSASSSVSFSNLKFWWNSKFLSSFQHLPPVFIVYEKLLCICWRNLKWWAKLRTDCRPFS